MRTLCALWILVAWPAAIAFATEEAEGIPFEAESTTEAQPSPYIYPQPLTFGAAIGSGMLAGVTVLTGFGVLAWVTDRRDVQPALVALGRRLRRRAATGASGD